MASCPYGIPDQTTQQWFLRDRNFNVDETVDKLNKLMSWRSEFRPDHLSYIDVAAEAATGKAYLHDKVDLSGRPVIVVRARLHLTGVYLTMTLLILQGIVDFPNVSMIYGASQCCTSPLRPTFDDGHMVFRWLLFPCMVLGTSIAAFSLHLKTFSEISAQSGPQTKQGSLLVLQSQSYSYIQ